MEGYENARSGCSNSTGRRSDRCPCAGRKSAVGPANWTGGYGGITGGYGWGHSDQTDPGPPIPHNGGGGEGGDGHYSVQGGLLGGTLGYNWQKGPWVYGVEGDFSWSDIKGRSEVCGAATVLPHPCGTNLNALGTFRSRLGYAAGANGNWLLYATGGVAIGNLHAWDTLTPASGNVWRAGWTAGAGVETVFAPRWTAKLEYLHVDLGDAQTFNIVPGVQESVGFRADILRAGINYRFGENPRQRRSFTSRRGRCRSRTAGRDGTRASTPAISILRAMSAPAPT